VGLAQVREGAILVRLVVELLPKELQTVVRFPVEHPSERHVVGPASRSCRCAQTWLMTTSTEAKSPNADCASCTKAISR
jgi:hypothetical protein